MVSVLPKQQIDWNWANWIIKTFQRSGEFSLGIYRYYRFKDSIKTC